MFGRTDRMDGHSVLTCFFFFLRSTRRIAPTRRVKIVGALPRLTTTARGKRLPRMGKREKTSLLPGYVNVSTPRPPWPGGAMVSGY